jgi:hypothetical protein
MNISLNQLAYRLIGIYRANYKITDSLSLRLVKDWIHATRAMLLKQQFDKPLAIIDEYSVQDLGPIELELVDSSIVPAVPSDRHMMRTTVYIPPTIERRGNIGSFTRVGPADRLEHRYKVVTFETALVSGFGKFNNRDVYAFYLDGRMYLIARDLNAFKHLEYLDIRGVFQNPKEAALIKDPTSTDDDNYPISRTLVDTMEDIIAKTKFNFVITPLQDKTADEEDDITNVSAR